MTNIIRATLILASVIFVPTIAFAQDADAGTPDGGPSSGPLSDCVTQCTTLINGLPSDQSELPEDATPEQQAELQARLIGICAEQIDVCADLNEATRAALPNLCDAIRGHRHGALAYDHHGEPPPAFCVLPDGTDVDHARHHCGCPSGTYPLRVSRERSADRLRSIGAPADHVVFVCYNPLAAPGAPGSGEERWRTLERALAETSDALHRLCDPHEGESLSAACARARQDFLNLGSGGGPVDLDPIRRSIADIEAANQRQDADIARLDHELQDLRETESGDMLGTRAAIQQLAESHSILLQCLRSGNPDFRVSWTGPGPDGHDITEEIPCTAIFEAADHRALAEARTEAARVARDTVREELSHTTTNGGGHLFTWVQAYGLVAFNPLTYGNVSYGNVWQLGGEFTVGGNVGGGVAVLGGLGIGYGGPNIQGATNVAAVARLGLGGWVIPELMFGGGFIATHRFLPDVFSADSLYGAYLDGTIRFSPHGAVSPVLTLRVAVGASPRQAGSGWDVQPNGLFEGLFGVAFF